MSGAFAIGFALPDVRDIRLSLYSVNGQRIYNTVLTGVRDGVKVIPTDYLASGNYFCSIDVGDRVLVRKITFAR